MYINIPEEAQNRFGSVVKNIQHDLHEQKGKKYEYPKTKEEYWDVVNLYWAELFSIILTFLPEEINIDTLERTEVHVIRLKENKDPTLCRYFNYAWASAPDDGRIHAIPAWHILCDLCSESYLLIEG